MFWKRKSEAPSPSRADAARAVSLDQPRPAPILKCPVPVAVAVPNAPHSSGAGAPYGASSPSPSPSPSPSHASGSGNIRFAGGVAESCASPTRPGASPRKGSLREQQEQSRAQYQQHQGQEQGQATAQRHPIHATPTVPTRLVQVQPLTSPQYMPSSGTNANANANANAAGVGMSMSMRRQPSPVLYVNTAATATASQDGQRYVGDVSPIRTSPNPAIQRVQGNRRSSRPMSPSSTSFGARVSYRPYDPRGPASASASPQQTSASPSIIVASPTGGTTPLTTPPMVYASHITTPPTAYVSSMQTRAPPPPSPYRPTSERRVLEPLSQPVRGSSLFDTPSSASCPRMSPGPGLGLHPNPESVYGSPRSSGSVPTLNIIPATPQQAADEWRLRRAASDLEMEIEGAFSQVSDVPLEVSSSPPPREAQVAELQEGMRVHHASRHKKQGSLPELEELQFSPFGGSVISLPASTSSASLPSDDSAGISQPAPEVARRRGTPTPPSATAPLPSVSQLPSPPSEPLPSPPFESFASLPSLDSEHSLPSSASSGSIRSSASSSSLNSYSDVEEALGSMLASLSDPSMPLSSMGSGSSLRSHSKPPRASVPDTDSTSFSCNPGLGLGLGLGFSISNASSISSGGGSGSGTAPLSPRRKAPPAPLDLSRVYEAAAPTQQSAPPVINHRVAFYSSARAAPNSSSSGVFIQVPHSSSIGSMSSQQGAGSPSATATRERTEFMVSTPVSMSRTWSETSLSAEDTELSYARDRRSTCSTVVSIRSSGGGRGGSGDRDSISIASEASDEDLHTASIVCLTPVVKGQGQYEYDYADEPQRGVRVGAYVAEVGVAL